MYVPLSLTFVDSASAAVDPYPQIEAWGAHRHDVVGPIRNQLEAVTMALRTGRPVIVPTAHHSRAELDELCLAAARFDRPVVYLHDGRPDAATRSVGATLTAHLDDVQGVLWGAGLTQLVDVDVIGDVHGQAATLTTLLAELGYVGTLGTDGFHHPAGRLPVFVGDLVDKGPENLAALRTVLAGVRRGQCLTVLGNHDKWLLKTLSDLATRLGDAGVATWREQLLALAAETKPGRALTLVELAADADGLADRFATLRRELHRLPLQLVLDGGTLVVVHASCAPEWVGHTPTNQKERRTVEHLHLFGPDRKAGYRVGEEPAPAPGSPTFVRGHVTVDTPALVNGFISVDTGAGDGISLTAMSWPAQRFTTVPVVATVTAPTAELAVA